MEIGNGYLEGMKDQRFFSMLGFTLLELLVAMVVALVLIGATYSLYTVQQREFGNQKLMLATRQNLRGAMMFLEQEIRLAGYDPGDTGRFGIIDVRRYDLVKSNQLDMSGQPALQYTCDMDENGALDNRKRNKEHRKFRISDVHNNGRICLSWDNGSGRRPLAENIQALGFAYAVDMDRDNRLDTWRGGSHLIWAVDSDNDNLLDTNIDANNDGMIDKKDDTNGDDMITWADGGQLNPQIPLDRIQAVQVWLLAVTDHPLQGHSDNQSYLVGDRISVAEKDGCMRQVLVTTIECRNL